MAITGQIFGITDPQKFFQSVLLGQAPAGYVPLSNQPFGTTATGYSHTQPGHLVAGGNFDSTNSSFKIADFAPAWNVHDVSLNVSLGGNPLYRSAVFPYPRAQQGGLDIYVNQPSAVGISASDIGRNIPANSGLPSNTVLQSFPWGIWAKGDQQGADVQFGMAFVPHTSTNLNVWAEVVIHGWNIHVGFPADCKVNAHEIRLQIQQALKEDTSPLNAFIKKEIMSVLTGTAGKFASDIFGLVSITFTSIRFQPGHQWAVVAKNDKTPVMNVSPTIGYPQKW
jgi:hypothetical protein